MTRTRPTKVQSRRFSRSSGTISPTTCSSLCLLFFYLGFLVPILKVEFEFPYVIYQGLTIYLLLAIGWHGGEELAKLELSSIESLVGFMGVGFVTNFIIGVAAYLALKFLCPKMRRIDQATVAGYYGSDSAGTFVTCLGVLGTAHIAFDAYMPVMLAIMEIPGCLVALYLVSRLRHEGMDALGNMPDEPGYDPDAKPLVSHVGEPGHHASDKHEREVEKELELSLEKREHPDVDHGNGNGNYKTKPGLINGKALARGFPQSGALPPVRRHLDRLDQRHCKARRSPATTTISSSRCFRACFASSCSRWG